MTNEEFVKNLRGKKLKDLSPTEIKRFKSFIRTKKLNEEEKSGRGQFRRAYNLSKNNIRAEMSKELLRTPLRPNKIAKDKDGKFLYTKDGVLKREFKK